MFFAVEKTIHNSYGISRNYEQPNNLGKEEQTWKTPTSLSYNLLQSYRKVIKIACYWHKDRHLDQLNKIERPELKPYIYGEMIFNKDCKVK